MTRAARPGFTLVETMFASAVSALVLGGVASFMLGAGRMARTAFAEAELSVQTRQLRDKLLFHAMPQGGGVCWPGLLSARASRSDGDVVEGGSKLLMKVYGAGVGDGKLYFSTSPEGAAGVIGDTSSRHNLQLVARSETAGGSTMKWLGNDDDRSAEHGNLGWLRPTRFGYLEDGWADGGMVLSHGLLFVEIAASMGGVSSRERVAVPLFGREQVKNTSTAGSVFFDD